MAEYMRREVVTKHVEYVLPSPVAWGEVYKAMAGIRGELGEDAAKWDDAAFFEARDDEIVIRFKSDEQVTR